MRVDRRASQQPPRGPGKLVEGRRREREGGKKAEERKMGWS